MKRAGSGIRLMMTADSVGGVWTYATSLARALGTCGYEIVLVTLGPRPTRAQTAMLRDARGVSLIQTDLELEWQDPAGWREHLSVGQRTLPVIILLEAAHRMTSPRIHLRRGIHAPDIKGVDGHVVFHRQIENAGNAIDAVRRLREKPRRCQHDRSLPGLLRQQTNGSRD